MIEEKVQELFQVLISVLLVYLQVFVFSTESKGSTPQKRSINTAVVNLSVTGEQVSARRSQSKLKETKPKDVSYGEGSCRQNTDGNSLRR